MQNDAITRNQRRKEPSPSDRLTEIRIYPAPLSKLLRLEKNHYCLLKYFDKSIIPLLPLHLRLAGAQAYASCHAMSGAPRSD